MSSSLTSDFSTAMRAGQLDRAQAMLADLPQQLPDMILRSVADLHMANQRWDEAAGALGAMKHRNVDAEMRRKLAANLAAFKKHRPTVYNALIQAEPDDRYSVAASKTGYPTVLRRNDRGGAISMSADNDPLGGVGVAVQSIAEAYRSGKAIGLCGIGDGYLLKHLAENPPQLALGRQQAICLIEPDAPLLLACCMIHDFTGSTGPIEQQRIAWFVGKQWAETFRTEFLADLFRMYPAITIRTGLESPDIEEELTKFLAEIAALDGRLVDETKRYYETLSRDDLLSAFDRRQQRRPRVLVLTTRFSTVLQYSSADVAEAFGKLGWETELLIEPNAWQGLNRIAMREAVARFKPDLIFQIDHLRGEYNDLFPANVPAVCWVQDHLPNLMNAAAGASVSLRDFVLTNAGHRYQREYGYPPRQLLHMTKATNVPKRSATMRRDRDIVFVSNAGRLPERLAEEIVSRVVAEPERGLLQTISQRLIELYAQGGCVETLPDLERFVCAVEQDVRRGINPGEARKQIISLLWHPLNDALYRQQSLEWVVDLSNSLGLQLELYGAHWEKHPKFAPFAKGSVQYGKELEELTRRSRISLHIAPFSWLHQRVLDGYVAGGFFLMRRHPANFVPYQLNRAVEGNANAEEMQRLCDEYRRLNELCDPIEHIRQLAGNGSLHELPLVDEISFADKESCGRLIANFIENPQQAEEIAARQREYVANHFTYESQMKRIVGEITELIRKEAA